MNREIGRLAAMIPHLCLWYETNRKPLPWRTDATPYHVWLSEIMLQQTRIEAVIPYYNRFLVELPTVKSLSEVDDDRLMKLWQGLGYYSRARNLKKAAVVIVERFNGEIPSDVDALRSLPGIGDYTAGAIASIAYGKPQPAVDGNVLRVVMRLCARYDDILLPATKKAVSHVLQAVYPSGHDAKLLTEGLMELGETVCVPNGAPRCEECPVREFCQAYANGVTDQLPIRSAKKERRTENRTVMLLSCNGKYALSKRPPKGLLASLWQFPNTDGHLTQGELKEYLSTVGITPVTIEKTESAKHIFSHVEWHMNGYRVVSDAQSDRFVWAEPAEIHDEYAIPTAFQYFKSLL